MGLSHMAINMSWEGDAGTVIIGDSRSKPPAHAVYSCPLVLLGLNPRFTFSIVRCTAAGPLQSKICQELFSKQLYNSLLG